MKRTPHEEDHHEDEIQHTKRVYHSIGYAEQ